MLLEDAGLQNYSCSEAMKKMYICQYNTTILLKHEFRIRDYLVVKKYGEKKYKYKTTVIVYECLPFSYLMYEE